MLAGSCSAEFGSLRFGGGKFFGERNKTGEETEEETREGSRFCVVVGIFFSQKHLRCLGSRLVVETAWERYARDESADGTVMLPCYVWSCWGAARRGGYHDCQTVTVTIWWLQ